VLAVLSERIRWSTAFKVVLFMPMAISALSAGVLWRIVYEQDPSRGTANAAIRRWRMCFGRRGHTRCQTAGHPSLAPMGKALLTSQTLSPGTRRCWGLWGPAGHAAKDAQPRPSRRPSRAP